MWNEEAAGLIRSSTEGLGLFDGSCFVNFSKVFVAGFSLTCPVRFREVDVDSPRPLIHGQFGDDGDEDGQMIACQFGGD